MAKTFYLYLGVDDDHTPMTFGEFFKQHTKYLDEEFKTVDDIYAEMSDEIPNGTDSLTYEEKEKIIRTFCDRAFYDDKNADADKTAWFNTGIEFCDKYGNRLSEEDGYEIEDDDFYVASIEDNFDSYFEEMVTTYMEKRAVVLEKTVAKYMKQIKK